MNPAWRHMALAVFDKQDRDQLTVEEIDQVISRYPYFAVLHYLKAGKLAADGDANAESCAAKTALFFHNPHWLNQQLAPLKELQAEHTEVLAELMITPHDAAILGAHEEIAMHDAEMMQDDLEAEYDSKRVFEEDEANDTGEYQAAEEQEKEKHGDEELAAEGLEVGSLASQQWSPEEVAVQDTDPEEQKEQDVRVEERATEIFEQEDNSDNDDQQVINVPGEIAAADYSSETILDIQGATENVDLVGGMGTQPSPETEALIPIEPLYTIDYFASQGIKLPVEDVPGDQLAVKLRSFTEWLKSMKRIQPEKMDRQLDHETEKQIRQTAEHSNENMEVYTEALADVYRKQGLDDRAVEVYQKLSLLDPAKSAYFAARIREIKEI